MKYCSLTKEQFDITEFAQVQAVMEELRPDCILNAAAYTNLDSDLLFRYLRPPIRWVKLLMALPNQDPLLAPPRSPLVKYFAFDESSLVR